MAATSSGGVKRHNFSNSWIIVLLCGALILKEGSAQCDDDSSCSYLASLGQCELDTENMLVDCPRVCKNPCACQGVDTQDKRCDCLVKAKEGYCYDTEAMVNCLTTCTKVLEVKCPVPPLPQDPNAHLSTYLHGYLANVTEVCNDGYVPENPRNMGMIFCLSDGTWKKDLTHGYSVKCIAIDCHSPPDSAHAIIEVTDTTVTHTANYTCDTGYLPTSGEPTLTCGLDGQWSGSVLTCIVIDCGAPPTSSHAIIVVTNTTYNHTANYTCEAGYLGTPDRSALTCELDGQWSGDVITCTEIDCHAPPSFPNTALDVSGTTYKQQADYTCLPGYTSPQGQGSLVCESDGQWTGANLTCTPVDCLSPPDSSHAVIDVTNTTYGHTANYTCQLGYTGVPERSSLTCGPDGQWSGTVVTCEEIDCRDPPASPNAVIGVSATTYGQTANYTCETGYVSTPARATLTCGQDGQWSGSAVSCIVIDCHIPPSSPHAQVDVTNTTFGHSASYVCEPGYQSSQGQGSVTCGQDGQWSGTVAVCSAVDCGPPTVGPGLTVQVHDTTYGHQANYSCAAGYSYVSGDTTLTCGPNGLWTGLTIKCLAKDCGPPDSREGTQAKYTTTTYGSVAVYSCQSGYEKANGSDSRTCQENQAWSGVALFCTPLQCPPAPVYAGAYSTTSDKMATYKCLYQPDGQEDLQWTLQCDSNFQWTGPQPQCGENNPNQPDKFKPEPKEAKWGWALGVGIFSIIASIIALFVILDIVLFRKHCKFCQSNLRSFKKKIKKKLRNRKTKPYDQESKFPSQANMKPEKANSITTSLSDVSQSSAETVLTEVAL